MKYTLPDGQVVNIKDPSTMNPQERAKFNQIMQQNYPDFDIYEDERTALGQLDNSIRSVYGGALQTGLSQIHGVLSTLGLPDTGYIQQGLSSLRENAVKPFEPDEAYADTWLTGLGHAAGSFAAMGLTMRAANPAVTRQMGKSKFFNQTKGFGTGRALLSPDKTRRQLWAPMAVMGAPFGTGQQFMLREQARERGEEVTYGDQWLSTLAGIPLGATELLPFERLFKGIRKGAIADDTGFISLSRLLKRGAAVSGTEAFQEMFAGFAHNIVARGLYDPDLPITDSYWDDFTMGGTLGFVASVGMDLVLNRRGIGNSWDRDREDKARKYTEKARIQRDMLNPEQPVKLLPDLSGQNFPSMETPKGFVSSEVDPSGARSPENYAEIIMDQAEEYFPAGSIFKAVFNPKTGKFDVLDENGTRWGVSQEDADTSARLAGELTQLSTQKFINRSIGDALYYSEGVTNEPRKWILGKKLRDPNYYLVPAQTIANYDSDLDYKTYPTDQPRRAIGAGVVKRAFPLWQKKMRRKGRKIKRFYTPAEAKKLLSKKDFNQLMSQRAQMSSTYVKQELEKLEAGKKSDKRKLEIEGGENYTPNKNTLQEIADSKNIILDTNSEAFKYFAESHTGTANWKNMTNGQKQLLLARFDSLPFFPSPTKLPLLKPRKFNREQFDAAYALIAGTGRANPNFISKELGIPRDAAVQLLNDLTESGRIIPTSKTKADVVPIEEWNAARRAQQAIDISEEPTAVRDRNESIQEYIDRTIQETGRSPLTSNVAVSRIATPEEVAAAQAEQTEQAREMPEVTLSRALTALQERLDKLGIGGMGIEFRKHFVDKNGKIDLGEEARFSSELQKLIFSLDVASDGGRLGEAETIDNLLGHMNHETIHVLRDLDLITEQEWNSLRLFVQRTKVPKAFLEARGEEYRGETWFERAERMYRGQTVGREIMGTQDFYEEAIAEAFRAYEMNSNFVKPKAPKTIWGKIKNFLRELFNSLRYGGYKRPADIFADITEGVIGSRPRGEIRTLRELDYMQGRIDEMEKLGQTFRQAKPTTPEEQKLKEDLQQAPPTFEEAARASRIPVVAERSSRVPGFDNIYIGVRPLSDMNISESSEALAKPDMIRPIFGGIREGTLGADQADRVSVMGPYEEAQKLFLDDNAEAIEALSQDLIARSQDTEKLQLMARALISQYGEGLNFKGRAQFNPEEEKDISELIGTEYEYLATTIKTDANLASLVLTMQSIELGGPMPQIRYYNAATNSSDEMLMKNIVSEYQRENSVLVGKDGYGLVAGITGAIRNPATGGTQVKGIDSFVDVLVENMTSMTRARQYNPRKFTSKDIGLVNSIDEKASAGNWMSPHRAAGFREHFGFKSNISDPTDQAIGIMKAMFSHQFRPGDNRDQSTVFTFPVSFSDRIYFANVMANLKDSGMPEVIIDNLEYYVQATNGRAFGTFYPPYDEMPETGIAKVGIGPKNTIGAIGITKSKLELLSSSESEKAIGEVVVGKERTGESEGQKKIALQIGKQERTMSRRGRTVYPDTTLIIEKGSFMVTPDNVMGGYGGTAYHEVGHSIDNIFRFYNNPADFISLSSPYFSIDLDSVYKLDPKKIQVNPLEGGKIKRIEFNDQTIGLPEYKRATSQIFWFQGTGEMSNESFLYEIDTVGMDESILGPILNEALSFYNIHRGTLYEDTDIARIMKGLPVEVRSLSAQDLRELNVETKFPFTRLPRSGVMSKNAISQGLSYPLTNLRALLGVEDGRETRIGVNMHQLEFVQKELFAQLFDMYIRFPQLLENNLPITYDVFSKLGEILSHAQATRLSISELIKPVQDVFRVTSATQNSENRISFADRYEGLEGTGGERASRRVARAISSTNRLNSRKYAENAIRERNSITEIPHAEIQLHTGYPKATKETPSIRESDIVRTRQRRSYAQSMELAKEAYNITGSPLQNYPRQVLEAYNKNVGLPKYRKKGKQVAKPKLQTRISQVYDRLQDITANTYKETALERKIFEGYRKPLRGVFNLLGITNYKQMVEASYNQLAVEVRSQYEALKNAGLDIEFHEGSEEYLTSGDMLADVHLFNHLWVFQGGTPSVLLSNVDGDGLTDNDKFRAVHDYFGHAVDGSSFGPSGEENAWDSHTRMFSPLATIALTAETRAQNSWVNYSGMNDGLNDLRRITANLRAEAEKLSTKGNHEAAEALSLKAEELGNEIRSEWVYADQKSIALPIEYSQPGFSRNLKSEFPLKLERSSRRAAPPKEGLLEEVREAEDTTGPVGVKGKIEQKLNEYFAKGMTEPEDWKGVAGAPKAENALSYSELRSIVQMGLDNNVESFFYEKFGYNSSQIVGYANMFEFSSMFGITSEVAKPEDNLQYALQAMITARKFDPLKDDGTTINPKYTEELGKHGMVLTNSQKERMAKIYRDGHFSRVGDFHKTPIYAKTIESMASNELVPYMTGDRWMARGMGFGMDADSMSPTNLRVANYLMSKLAYENDYTLPDGRITKLTVPQVQSVLWYQFRSGTNLPQINRGLAVSEGTWDTAENRAKEQITEIDNMKRRGEWIADAPLKKIFPKAQISWTQGNKTNNFSTKVGGQLNKILLSRMPTQYVGLTPGETRGYRYQNLTEKQRQQLAYDMMDSITDANGNLRILSDLSIPHNFTITYGMYGIPEYNFQLQMYGSREEADTVSKMLGDSMLQDSVAVTSFDPQGQLNSVAISKEDGSQWTEPEMRELAPLLSPFTYETEEGRVEAGLSATTDGKRLVVIDPKALVLKDDYTDDAYSGFANKLKEISDYYGYNINGLRTNNTLNEYKDKGYEGAIEELGHRSIALRRPNLQRTALNNLYIPAWKAYSNFGKREGITAENTSPPWEGLNSSLGKPLVNDTKALENQLRAEKIIKDTPRGGVPLLGRDASVLALNTYFEEQSGKTSPDLFNIDRERSSRSSSAPVSDDIQKRIDEVAPNYTPEETMGETMLRVAEMGPIKRRFTELRAAFIDRYARIEQISREMQESLGVQLYADTDAYSVTLMADRARGIFAASMKYGAPVYVDGYTKVETIIVTEEESIQFNLPVGTEVTGLIDILQPLYNREGGNLEEIFKYYAMVKRGVRLSNKLDKDGNYIEVPTTQEDVQNIEKLENQYPELKEVYAKYQLWNNRLIDFATKTGLLNETTAEQWKNHADYYPFYRQFEGDDTMKGPRIFSGIVGANMGQELKGGTDPVNVPMLDAILKNTLAITTASMKNVAAQRVIRDAVALNYAKPVPNTAKGPSIVRIKVDGNDAAYHIEDPLLYSAMQAFGDSGLAGVTRILATPATVLREAVTRDPGFILVNLMRDTMSAFVTSGADYVPVLDTLKGFVGPLQDLEMLGVVGGYDFSNDPKDVVKYVKQIYKKQGLDMEGGNRGPVTFWKLWDGLGMITTRSDAATRKAVYNAVLKETGNEAEAAFQALEIINFGRRGGHPLMRVVTASIPFMNARIQGLDVLWRAGVGRYTADRKNLSKATQNAVLTKSTVRFLYRGFFLSMLTALYYAMVSDDEEYKKYRNVRQEVIDDNWIIPISEGFSIKLPIPFEVGAIFKVIPERLIDTLYGEGDADSFMNSISRQLWVTFELNPLDVQLVGPLIGALNNKNSYTGTDIVPYYLETGVEPRYQYKEGTNELAVQLGNALNISPLKIEYIMRGYGGTLGSYLLNITDYTLKSVSGKDYIPRRFEAGLADAVLGQLAGRFYIDPRRAGGLQQQFYDLRTETRTAVQTFNKLRKEGRIDEAVAYFRARPDLFKMKNVVNRIDQYLENFRQRRLAIQTNETLSPALKKELIQQLELERDRFLAIVPDLKKQANIPTRWVDIITPPTM